MGGKKLIRQSCQASTIIEVVVAMILIVVVFGIAMMIYTNVVRTSPSARRMKVAALLEQVMAREERNAGNPAEQTESFDDIDISIKVMPWNDQEQLLWVSLEAYDRNKQPLGGMNKVILKR